MTDWRELYATALIETNLQYLAVFLSEAEDAILQRAKELTNHIHRKAEPTELKKALEIIERGELEKALETINQLRVEKLGWPPPSV